MQIPKSFVAISMALAFFSGGAGAANAATDSGDRATAAPGFSSKASVAQGQQPKARGALQVCLVKIVGTYTGLNPIAGTFTVPGGRLELEFGGDSVMIELDSKCGWRRLHGHVSPGFGLQVTRRWFNPQTQSLQALAAPVPDGGEWASPAWTNPPWTTPETPSAPRQDLGLPDISGTARAHRSPPRINTPLQSPRKLSLAGLRPPTPLHSPGARMRQVHINLSRHFPPASP